MVVELGLQLYCVSVGACILKTVITHVLQTAGSEWARSSLLFPACAREPGGTQLPFSWWFGKCLLFTQLSSLRRAHVGSTLPHTPVGFQDSGCVRSHTRE